MNTPPVAYGTSSFATTCAVANNATNAANATNSTQVGGVGSSSSSAVNATGAYNRTEACVPAVVLSEGGSASVLLEVEDKETPRGSLVFEVVTPPEHGAFSLVEADPPIGSSAPRIGTLKYTPKELWHGYDAVTFRVFDGFVYSNEATVHFVVKSVNNPPVLACHSSSSSSASSSSSSSASSSTAVAMARAAAASAHPLCASPIDGGGWLKPQPADPVLYAHAVARTHLAPNDALPASLRLRSGGGGGGGGLMTQLRALADAVVRAHGGQVPLVVTGGGGDVAAAAYTVPMGGGVNDTEMKLAAVAASQQAVNAANASITGLGGAAAAAANASSSAAANASSNPAAFNASGGSGYTPTTSSSLVEAAEAALNDPTVWGRGGQPVYLAVALLGYDPDDEVGWLVSKLNSFDPWL